MADLVDRELNAAGITGSHLRLAYRAARSIHATHGRSYFLATRLLTPAQRPAVHALYGFARYADEVVDDIAAISRGPSAGAAQAGELDRLGVELRDAIDEHSLDTASGDPVVLAVADTIHRYALDPALFDAFLTSMRMDITVTDYPDYAALRNYMYGSAAVIGLQMLPVLGTVTPPSAVPPNTSADAASEAAQALGIAFQLTNFLRDVGEDLDRGRVYLPADEMASFGVTTGLLAHCRDTGTVDEKVRALLAYQAQRARSTYRQAEPGIQLLAPVSRPCIRTAYRLYSAILDRVVAHDYAVLHRRVAVPWGRRVTIAAPEAVKAYLVRYTALGKHSPAGVRAGVGQCGAKGPSPEPGA
jgi:phytoene synthase